MLFNNANDAVFVTQLSKTKLYGDFIEVNEVACKQLGYTKDEFLKLSPSAIISPKFIDEFNKQTERLLTNSHVIYELVHRAKDSKKNPVEISSHLFTYEGNPTVLSIARDITKRKRVEVKLRKTGLRLRKLADNVDVNNSKALHQNLSNREYQIMCFISLGKSADEIGEELSISIHTVYSYRNRILEKMHLKSNVELTQYAIQNKLIEL